MPGRLIDARTTELLQGQGPLPLLQAGPGATRSGMQGQASATTPYWCFVSAMAQAGGKLPH